MNDTSHCDVAIVGGGPGGSAAATVLARRGWQVALFERERFPRFHVGESLLPFQGDLLRRLGLEAKLAEAGFVRKYGALFLASDGSCSSQIDFGDLLAPPNNYAYQVERATFDRLLLDHAREAGARVFEEHAVVEATTGAADTRLVVRGRDGAEQAWRARWVIDASGQTAFLSRRLGLRADEPRLRKVALFAHFVGGKRREGRREGDICLVFGDRCWFWQIPFTDGRSSVGCIIDHELWKASALDAGPFFTQAIAATPWLADWLATAEQVTDVHTVANFSYSARHFVGPGWLLVGDAATFLDPIFSTGVLLALVSGERAALALDRQLQQRGLKPGRALARYERTLRSWTRQYFRLIHAFYQPHFPAILFNPVPFFQRPITYFLAGQLDLPWYRRVVVELFHGVVRLNRRYWLVPDPRPATANAHHG